MVETYKQILKYYYNQKIFLLILSYPYTFILVITITFLHLLVVHHLVHRLTFHLLHQLLRRLRQNLSKKIVIGELYMQGKGCTQSFQDAQKCFEFAAEANQSIAQLYLGHMHACGDGNVEQSYETGRIYYELAATQGLLLASNCLHVLDVLKKEKITQDPDSTYVLSTWYRTGHTPIIQKSRGRSLELLQLAMERGCSQLETRQNECAAMEKEIKIEKQNEHKKQKHRKKQQSLQRSNRNGSQKSMKCEKYWSSGSCKFGDACRNSHDETGVIARFDLHVHSIGPDSSKKRKKNLCDKCGKKTKTTGFRCISGCDWDICLACLK